MRAHLLGEGGALVTGTHDVTAARRAAVAEHLSAYGIDLDEAAGEFDRLEIADASRLFRARDAVLETGRIVPAGPDHPDGYSWFWHAGFPLGKRGATRAVIWR